MANVLLTRAAFRDEVRRCLGIIPPIDVPGSGAAPGDQPSNSPKPTNQEINQALQNAVSDCNRDTEFHQDRFDVPVTAQSSDLLGPFFIELSTLNPNRVGVLVQPVARIITVQRVTWHPGELSETLTNQTLLTPVFRDSLDRSGTSDYYTIPASTPRYWFVDGYGLLITPAQNIAGVFQLTCATGIRGLQCDTDTLDGVPIDYQNIFLYGAIMHVSIAETQDVEWKDRAGAYGGMFRQGVQQFKRWVYGGTGAPQPTMAFASYRGGYGTRRVVR